VASVTRWRAALIGLAGLAAASPALADPPPAPPPQPPTAVSLPELVQRYIAWRGGDAYLRLQTLHETAQTGRPQGALSLEQWMDRQGRVLVRSDLGSDRRGATTPEGSWSTNASGQVLEEPNGYESARRYAALVFGDALLGRGGAAVKLAGSAHDSNGKTWSVVQVTFGDADSFDALIDPATGGLCCYLITERGVQRFETFDDWRLVDGVRMPFAQAIRGDDPQAARFDQIELNGPLDPAALRRPASVHVVSFKPGATWSGWIPFELYKNEIYLPAKLNGRDTEALLDSGASGSVVDASGAAAFGLTPKGEVSLMGAQAMGHGATVGGVSIDAGELRLDHLTVATADLTQLAQVSGRPLPLVLGDEVFNETVVDIDFAARRLAFRDPAHFVPPPGAVELPLSPGLFRTMPVSLERRAPAAFIVDLGDAGTIDVFPAYAKAQNLMAGRRLSQTIGLGIAGGLTTSPIGALKEVQLAGASLADVPATFSEKRSPGTDDRIAGRMGTEILSRFHLMLDYPHDRLWLAPNADAAQPFARGRLGLAMLPEAGALVVKLVAPGSPGAAAGFQVGDRIAAIDGKPAAAWTMATLETLTEAAPGTSVRIALESGVTRTVALADYY
jgi:PDZ domain/Aspartyl protease